MARRFSLSARFRSRAARAAAAPSAARAPATVRRRLRSSSCFASAARCRRRSRFRSATARASSFFLAPVARRRRRLHERRVEELHELLLELARPQALGDLVDVGHGEVVPALVRLGTLPRHGARRLPGAASIGCKLRAAARRRPLSLARRTLREAVPRSLARRTLREAARRAGLYRLHVVNCPHRGTTSGNVHDAQMMHLASAMRMSAAKVV